MPRTKSPEQLCNVAMISKEITTFVQSEENVQYVSLHTKINCSEFYYVVVDDPI